MEKNRKSIIIIGIIWMLLTVLLAFIAGYIIGRHRVPEPEVEVKTEWKTVYIDKPEPVSSRILKDRYFFLPVVNTVTNTETVHDTTYIQVPVEQKEYKDSLYHAWVSGYRPQLDSLHLFIPEKTITQTVERRVQPRWSLGIQGGYGISNSGLTPYLGIGLTYNILSFGER